MEGVLLNYQYRDSEGVWSVTSFENGMLVYEGIKLAQGHIHARLWYYFCCYRTAKSYYLRVC
jgi:hypothetical protein